MNANKPTVIITGGSGLIGSAVAERLAGRYQVIAFDVKDGKRLPPGTEFVHVDLTKDESVHDGLRQVRDRHGDRIASVIHLAAYYSFSGEPSPLYDEITVKGTGRMLRELKAFEVGQLVFSSTMLVHAPCKPGQKINEDWPLKLKWDYPKSKVETEQLLRDHHRSIPLVIQRIAGVYDDHCHSIPIAHQIQRIYERRMISRVYPGDVTHGQAFLHLDDLIDAIENTVERRADLPAETTLLVGEPETMSYGELQRELGRLIHGEEWETTQIPKPVAKAGAWVQDILPLGDEPFIKPWMIDLADDHYELDVSRAAKLLGWRPERRLRDMLPMMVQALKEDPAGWYRENKLAPSAEVKREAAKSGAR